VWIPTTRLHLQKVPFLLESKLKEEGSQYTKGQDWHSHAVFDNNLITGASCDLRVPSLTLPFFDDSDTSAMITGQTVVATSCCVRHLQVRTRHRRPLWGSSLCSSCKNADVRRSVLCRNAS